MHAKKIELQDMFSILIQESSRGFGNEGEWGRLNLNNLSKIGEFPVVGIAKRMRLFTE